MSQPLARSTQTGPVSNSRLHQAALDYGRRGWPVFPISPDSRIQVSEASTSLLEIGRWWRDTPDADIAIQTGGKSGLWALKVKGPAGLEALARLEAKYSPLPHTTTAVSEDGGRDYLFAWPPGCRIASLDELPGYPFAVSGEAGHLIVPPSTRVAGPGPHWSLSPNHKDPAFAPSWLLDLVTNVQALPNTTAPVTKPVQETPVVAAQSPCHLPEQVDLAIPQLNINIDDVSGLAALPQESQSQVFQDARKRKKENRKAKPEAGARTGRSTQLGSGDQSRPKRTYRPRYRCPVLKALFPY